MGSHVSNVCCSRDYPSINDIKNYRQLLQAIKRQIEDNQHTYGLLSQDVLNILFDELDKYSFTEEQLRDLSSHLLKYMREGLIRSTIGETKKDFVPEFGKKIRRVWDQAFFQNKNTLRVISYIIKGIDERDCYLKLTFNLDPKETIAVARKTRQLCKFDLRAVLFLTHYLISSCLNLERSGRHLEEIQRLFIDAVNTISKQFPPAPPLKDSEETRVHKSYKTQVNPKDSINLKEFEENKKKEALKKFILKQAEQASKNYNTFDELVEETCKQRGYHFKIGVKIRDQSQKRAIDRVTQKMLGKAFKKYTLQDYSKENQRGKTIQEFIKKQERLYEIQMEQIYSKVAEPIQFKVSDMLRAKCLFRTVTDINACTQELKRKVQNSNCKLVELDNRFSGQVKTSDIVLKILVKKTIAQLQLPIEFDVAQNQFAHKIYEITRSKFFSPFTMLKIINEEIKKDYLKQIVDCFKVNNAYSHQHQLDFYNSSFTEQNFKGISFKSMSTSLTAFLKMLGFVYADQQSEKKSLVLQEICNQFIAIRQQSKNVYMPSEKQKNMMLAISKNNGQYLKQIKRYDHSLDEFDKYLKQIQIQNSFGDQKIAVTQKNNNKFLPQEKSGTYTSIGNVYKQLGNYQAAQKQYLKSLQIQEIISGRQTIDCALIHNNIGLMYRKQGGYEKALKQYKISLQIQERVVGKEAVDCALIRNNIGDVYKEQGNYEMALQQFIKSLQIRQKKQGNQTIECAKIHNNIGSVHYLKGNYQKALKQYIRCLQIQQKMVGRQAIVCASSHNNIAGVYCLVGNYPTALAQYRRSLEIKERILGKDSLDCAIVHSNIGDVLQKLGNPKIALEQYTKSLQIQERVLGKDAIDCASTHMNIGGLLKEKGNFQAALKQVMKSLQITERVLGQDDIRCAAIHNSIGSIYRMQGCYKQSLQQYMLCLYIQEKILGGQAIDCASTHNNIGNLYRMQSFYQKALEQFTNCLRIQQRILGKQAVVCATTHINISSVLQQLGRYNQAVGQLQICLMIQEKIFGSFSIECAATHSKIGDVLVNVRFEAALSQYKECLKIYEAKLGKESKQYINTLGKISSIENQKSRPLEMITISKPIDMTANLPRYEIMAKKIELIPSKQKPNQQREKQQIYMYERQRQSYKRQMQQRQIQGRKKLNIGKLNEQKFYQIMSPLPPPVPYLEKRKLY